MQKRLASVLIALAVIVSSGTAPVIVAAPALAASEAAIAATVDVDTGPRTVESAGQQDRLAPWMIDATAWERRAQAIRLVGLERAAETVRAAQAEREVQAAQAAEAIQAAEAERVAQAALVAEAEAAAAREAEAARAAAAAQTTSEVQRVLLDLGYASVGAVDGMAGPRTQAAIKAFQADAGQPVSGEASVATLAQLVEKSDAGWRRPAPVVAAPRQASAPRSVPTAASAGAVPAPVAPAPAVAWKTYVSNSGSQSAIDLCAGGLTSFRAEDGHAYFAVPYLTIHNNCGGSPILKLSAGDLVVISGGGVGGTYQVVDSRDVSQGSTSDAVAGLSGDIYLQTCYFNSTTMRVVGATKVS